MLCVYLPISLGYSVLFQDADVVWLKDPVHDYFLKPETAGDFDVWFQDDGSRSTRFSPYFSSTFYYYYYYYYTITLLLLYYYFTITLLLLLLSSAFVHLLYLAI